MRNPNTWTGRRSKKKTNNTKAVFGYYRSGNCFFDNKYYFIEVKWYKVEEIKKKILCNWKFRIKIISLVYINFVKGDRTK